jgi:hypothetical protein
MRALFTPPPVVRHNFATIHVTLVALVATLVATLIGSVNAFNTDPASKPTRFRLVTTAGKLGPLPSSYLPFIVPLAKVRWAWTILLSSVARRRGVEF